MKHSLSLILLLLAPLALQAQTDKATSPKVMIEVTDMNPLRFQSKNLSPGYTLQLRNDSAIVRLPYMGEVFVPSMNFDERLDYELPYTDYKTYRNKKDTATEYRFKVRRGIIDYQFLLTVYDEGKAYIDLIPSNATSCSYTGRVADK